MCKHLLPPDQGSLGEGSLSRSASQSSGLNVARRHRVRTIFPHTSGNNNTLLSFDEGDIISLLIHEEKDGWLYGELDRTRQYVFSAYDYLYNTGICWAEHKRMEHAVNISSMRSGAILGKLMKIFFS